MKNLLITKSSDFKSVLVSFDIILLILIHNVIFNAETDRILQCYHNYGYS